MGRTRRRSGAALAQGGFTYLELTVCMALMITILGLFVMAVESGSDALALSSRKGQIMWECLEALTMLERDFRETDAATIATHTFAQSGFDDPQTAVAFASARDASGAFRYAADYRPSWHAVIVYCPYVTEGGIRQLRRYVYYGTGYQFPLEFWGASPVTSDSISLRDQLGQALVIDRHDGNPDAAPNYLVLCAGVSRLDVTEGSPWRLAIAARSRTRRGEPILSLIHI